MITSIIQSCLKDGLCVNYLTYVKLIVVFAFSSNDYCTEGIPLVRISNIKNNTIDLSECVFIQNTIDNKFLISKGDLLIAMSGATTGKNRYIR